ncbi:hypothetical protein T310_7039 [Rasamsonia emersonii CBS 393.64]|uniref:Uncharacterized protein n=1 Tax=Rasamsonia emersonii (strain ATCC 16479 / CBS 393.64 / IMI 116815) TaxID=1408163 RepID=A0A0F4YMC8_RASE3|nr:hypothetical protein T310_7039 [Rasamsonia emersonii CBS 393.64]KKA19011.1 hypothetical protein T310_7039 [Rasamsonia emersonii CBS 393.64]
MYFLIMFILILRCFICPEKYSARLHARQPSPVFSSHSAGSPVVEEGDRMEEMEGKDSLKCTGSECNLDPSSRSIDPSRDPWISMGQKVSTHLGDACGLTALSVCTVSYRPRSKDDCHKLSDFSIPQLPIPQPEDLSSRLHPVVLCYPSTLSIYLPTYLSILCELSD